MHHPGLRHLLLTALLLAPVAAASAATPGEAPAVGEAATVVDRVTGTLGGPPREIVVKDNVFSQEVIETGPLAAAKLVFRDGSEFILGASSRVTLDRFVYDAETGTGQLVMNMLSGVFEFASGLMRPSSYDLRTPFATLAIRGTRLVVDVEREFVYVRSSSRTGTPSSVEIRLRDGRTVKRFINEGVTLGPGGEPRLCERNACPPLPDPNPAAMPTGVVEQVVIDLPIPAPRQFEAPADRPLVLRFGDLSRLTLFPAAQARVERYVFDREQGAGELGITALRGMFSFNSGKMPSSSYTLRTMAGEVRFRGTCTYGMAEGYFVLRCPELVTVTYKDGQVALLDEGEGVSLLGGTLTSCMDGGCAGQLAALNTALLRIAVLEQPRPPQIEQIRSAVDRIIQTLPSPDRQSTQSAP